MFENLQSYKRNMKPYNEMNDEFFKALIRDSKDNNDKYHPDKVKEKYGVWNSTSLGQSLAVLTYFSLYEKDHFAYDYTKRNITGYIDWCKRLSTENRPHFINEQVIQNVSGFLSTL